MFEMMLRNMIPLLLVKLAAISLAEKRTFALAVENICAAYLEGNIHAVSDTLSKVSIPDHQALVRALFSDGNQG